MPHATASALAIATHGTHMEFISSTIVSDKSVKSAPSAASNVIIDEIKVFIYFYSLISFLESHSDALCQNIF